jgi:hypothetical protein
LNGMMPPGQSLRRPKRRILSSQAFEATRPARHKEKEDSRKKEDIDGPGQAASRSAGGLQELLAPNFRNCISRCGKALIHGFPVHWRVLRGRCLR